MLNIVPIRILPTGGRETEREGERATNRREVNITKLGQCKYLAKMNSSFCHPVRIYLIC